MQSAYPASVYGAGAGSLVGGSFHDLENPLAVPAATLGLPTHTGYELNFSGATTGRLTDGRFLDFTGENSPLPGSLPFRHIVKKLRLGARDHAGNLVLGLRFDQLPADMQNWNTITKTGPWFVAPEDKAEVLAIIQDHRRRVENAKKTIVVPR